MAKDYSSQIAQELALKVKQIEATIGLLDGGATVPFISRYRKEATGSLDEVMVTKIRDRVHQLRELDKRRETVLQTIKKQGKLTKELESKILAAQTMAVLEDLYLPYKPKRRTRATVAKEKGLEPLAKLIFAQKKADIFKEAEKYVNEKKKVPSVEAAIAGARDIIAEWINENTQARAKLRALFQQKGVFHSKVVKGKEEAGHNYKDYFKWQELARKTPSHRVLAVRRGEKEKFLTVRILVPEDEAVAILKAQFVNGDGEDARQVAMAAEDSFKRLLSLSLETEYRLELKKEADLAAIDIFNNNLRQLLMAPPLGQKRILAIDPGVRTGSKVVCLDEQGQLIEYGAIFISGSQEKKDQAVEIVKDLVEKYTPDIIAIGNGTASRETEAFVNSIDFGKDVQTVMVSETGASIYSASNVARQEFPDYDVTVRGSISIGRRLMDPLAELVKIEPKSIGVGQYQHDVDQKLLKLNLDDVVMSCVNQVGVEVNTASKELLMYVSGLGPTRAQAIIDYRNENGPFATREEISKVPALGDKAYEQAAGFLRIQDGKNPLDASAVHPESYRLVDKILKDNACTIKDLMNDEQKRNAIKLKKYITEEVGLPTLMDIRDELAKPGRDPRDPFQLFKFKEGVEKIEDIEAGMKLSGVVTNITAFGAFVDIGIHHDGLIHISQLSDKFVKDPHDIVKVHQPIEVSVLEVDLNRRRIALTCRNQPVN